MTRGRALLVFDREHRILLRAGGQWETYGEVARVCRAAGAPSPTRSGYSGAAKLRSRSRKDRKPPLYAKAPGYRRLRTRPRGRPPLAITLIALAFATIGCAAFAGALPALALPQWVGSARVLLGIAGVVLAAAGGVWLCVAVSHVAMDAVRWAAASQPSPEDGSVGSQPLPGTTVQVGSQ